MNDFEKLLARYGGLMADMLLEGKEWAKCIGYLDTDAKRAAQGMNVRFIDKHCDERREEQGREGEIWAIYAYTYPTGRASSGNEETKYYRIDGQFNSYGYDDKFMGFYEVEGVEVTVTKFKPKA